MTIMEDLYILLQNALKVNCPILSGNMKSGIRVKSMNENEIVLEIEAKFYDVAEYERSRKIVYTGENKNGITDYAEMVNREGAFGTHNKSENWVDDTCLDVCNVIARKYGGDIDV